MARYAVGEGRRMIPTRRFLDLAGAANCLPDGKDWRTVSMPTGTWCSIAFGGGKFVAVQNTAASTTCAYSTDGINWSTGTMPSGNWNSVCHNGSVFAAVSQTSGTLAATSSDGNTWTTRTLPSTGTWWSVCAKSNGNLVAFSSASQTAYATSTNGVNWSAATMPTTGSWIGAGASSTGTFLALRSGAAGNNSVYSSTTGATGSWTARTTTSATWYGVGIATGTVITYMVAASDGSTYKSTSGTSYASGGSIAATSNPLSIAGGRGLLIAVRGTTGFYTSVDGTTWVNRATGITPKAIAYGNNIFVAVAANTAYVNPNI